MQLLCPADPSVSRRVWIGSGESEVGPRIGGRAPGGVQLAQEFDAATYLMTLPLSVQPELEASVFLSFDFEGMADNSGLLRPNGLVTVVAHGQSRRADTQGHVSLLSEHPLVLGDSAEDEFVSDNGVRVIRSSHKIGGRPFFLHGEPQLEADVEAAYRSGFRQLVQLAFPGGSNDATVSGDWPFGDGLFHVFVREDGEQFEFLRFWEF